MICLSVPERAHATRHPVCKPSLLDIAPAFLLWLVRKVHMQPRSHGAAKESATLARGASVLAELFSWPSSS